MWRRVSDRGHEVQQTAQVPHVSGSLQSRARQLHLHERRGTCILFQCPDLHVVPCNPIYAWCLPPLFEPILKDAAFVKKKYEKTYQEVVEEASSLNFSNLGLKAELAELDETLGVCKERLRVLDLSKNSKITGTLDVVAMCEALKILKLEGCHGLTGAFR